MWPKNKNILSERWFQPIVAMGSLACTSCTARVLMKFDRIFLSNTGYLFSHYISPSNNLTQNSWNSSSKDHQFYYPSNQRSFGDVQKKAYKSKNYPYTVPNMTLKVTSKYYFRVLIHTRLFNPFWCIDLDSGLKILYKWLIPSKIGLA